MPRFATICHYSPLLETVPHYSHYSRLFTLFVLFAIRYSRLLAVRYSRLFDIPYSGFLDIQSTSLRSVTTTSCRGYHLETQLQISIKLPNHEKNSKFCTSTTPTFFVVVDPPTFRSTCCCELTVRWSVRCIKIPAHSMVR